VKLGKKAMAAVIDAFIFITIIGIIAAGMFVYSHSDDNRNAMAKEYHDSFFAIELRTNDLFEGTDTQCVRMCDLVAAHIASDEGTVREYAENVMRSIIPPIYGYKFVFEYDGRTMAIGDGDGRVISQYSSDTVIISGKTMHSVLYVY